MDNAFLIRQALAVRENAYAPYSGFRVGAALLGKSGRVYTGCNVENAAYSPSNCAERTAVFKAISEGERSFDAIVIVGGKDGRLQPTPPCGVCRQVLYEFGGNALRVILATSEKDYTETTLGALLPHGFGPQNLG